jgi:hypothetical protein
MILYQAVIMAAVVIAIYILAFILKFKRRKVLVLSVVALITAGGVGLYAVQYAFGNHYYTQELDSASIENIHLTAGQQRDIAGIFSGYKRIAGSAHSTYALGRYYHISGNGAKSVIESSIYIFSNARDADNYFKASQKFYDNKNYIPLDSFNSKIKGKGRHYLVSLVKSEYKDYTDLVYLPSKITYSSDLVIEDGNVIVQLDETANKPVTNKQVILDGIVNRLGQHKER